MSSRKKQKAKKTDPYAKHKLAAIPVLLIILGYVLWGDSSGAGNSSKLSDSSNTGGAASEVASAMETAPAVRKTAEPVSERHEKWSDTDLSFLHGPNPLASYRNLKPDPAVSAAKLKVETPTIPAGQPEHIVQTQLAAELTQLPLKYRFRSGRRDVVMLGDRILESGDSLGAGLQVDRVLPTHLILKPTRQSSDSIQ